MHELIIPKPIILPLNPGRPTLHGREFARWAANKLGWRENDIRKSLGLEPVPGGDRIVPQIAGGMASFSDYLELKVLDLIFNDPGTTFISGDTYLGLWTSTLTDASTGATANEATYGGYGRAEILPASMSAAAAGSKTNSTAITFAACSSTSSTITFWGTCDNGSTGAGNMLVWGTCTSTTVDTSHTPATIAIGALVVTLD